MMLVGRVNRIDAFADALQLFEMADDAPNELCVGLMIFLDL